MALSPANFGAADLTPLERAVTTVLVGGGSQCSAEARAEATRYCEAFQADPDSWRHCCEQFVLRSQLPSRMTTLALAQDACHSAPVSNADEGDGNRLTLRLLLDWFAEPRFWFLQIILGRLESLSSDMRTTVRELLSAYVERILPSRSDALAETAARVPAASTHPNNKLHLFFHVDNGAVMIKVALLYIRLLMLDYPLAWPDAVRWLICHVEQAGSQFQRLKSTEGLYAAPTGVALQRYASATQFFLLVWEVFEDEVASDIVDRNAGQRAANMRVKDGLREGDIVLVSNVLKTTLENFQLLQAELNFPKTNVEAFEVISSILSRALKVTASLVLWVDIQIVANPTFFGRAVLPLFDRRTGCGASAMEVFKAIFSKRMDAAQRIVLTHQLRILDEIVNRSEILCFRNATAAEAYITEHKNALSPNDPSTYLTNVNCDDPDQYVLALGELIGLAAMQILQAFKDLRRGYDAIASTSSGGDGTSGNSSEDSEKVDVRVWGGVQSAGRNPYFTPITSPSLWKDIQNEAWRMLMQIFPRVCLVYSHPHPKVAELMVPFLHDFLVYGHSFLTGVTSNRVKPTKSSVTDIMSPLQISFTIMEPWIMSLFKITLERLQYPYWFDFSSSDETECQEIFMAYREAISTNIVKQLYAIDEPTSLKFLVETTRQLVTAVAGGMSTSAIHASQCEAALFLVKKISEYYKDVSKVLTHYDHPLAECLRLIFGCRALLQYPDGVVRTLVFSLAATYTPFLHNKSLHASGQKCLEDFLELLLGPYGVRGFEDRNGQAAGAAAVIALLRLISVNPTVFAPFAPQIVQALQDCNLLVIHYVSTDQAERQQKTCNEIKGASYGVFPPEDQNRCFEAVGALFNIVADIEHAEVCRASRDGQPPNEAYYSKSRALLSQVLDPNIQVLCAGVDADLKTFDGRRQNTLCSNRRMLVELATKDFQGVAKYTAALFTAVANFTKRITQKHVYILGQYTTRLLECLQFGLQILGLSGIIRSSSVLLIRRLAFLHSHPHHLELLKYTTAYLLDITLWCFVSSVTEASTNPGALNSTPEGLQAFGRLNALNLHKTWAKSAPQLEVHQEVTQLCGLISFIVGALKNHNDSRRIDQFLTGPVPCHSVSGIALQPLSDAYSLSSFLGRILAQAVDCYHTIPTHSAELLRQKAELQQEVFQMLNVIATYAPASLLSLIETPVLGLDLLEWLFTGIQPSSISGAAALAASFCLQTWNHIISAVLGTVVRVHTGVNVDDIVYNKLRVTELVHMAMRLAFSLDLEDPQHNKALQEICSLFKCLTTLRSSVTDSNPEVQVHKDILQSLFISAVPSHTCSPQDAAIVLDAVTEASSIKDAKDILKKWIITQHFAAGTYS